MRSKSWMLFVAAALPLISAGPLSNEDRQYLLAQYEESRKGLAAAVAGVNDAQWTFKPGPERWSIAECVEHIAAVEQALFGMVTGRILKSPASDEFRGNREGDEKLKAALTNRSQKASAPEPLRPNGRFGGSRAEVLAAFKESREKIETFARTTETDLRGHGMKSALGPLDGMQWMLYISAHTQRHTAQILEVKADAGYPK